MISLSKRLKLYIDLFAKRPDLYIWSAELKAPTDVPELPEQAGLLRESAISFAWSFEQPYAVKPSGDGGCLWLHPGHGEGWLTSSQRWLEGVSSSLVVDFVVEEGFGLLVVEEGDTIADAVPAFYDANDETVRRFGGLEEYLTLGAKRGFTWYWQNDDCDEWADLLERLHRGSLPADVGSDRLHEGLVGAGATHAEADALSAWLGEDARLLVPSRP